MKTTISTFKPKASFAEQAIVLIFDLEGFSKFFSQPDVHEYVPKFLNYIIHEIEQTIKGGKPKWAVDTDGNEMHLPVFPELLHSKFLGDGGMYIWRYEDFTEQQRLELISTFWLMKLKFKTIVRKMRELIPFLDIPKKIRFGISAGSVYKLTYEDSHREEYIGYSINLASRLQNYCSEIGFIVSGRLNIAASDLEGGQYQKVVANKIKGFPQEIVIVDQAEYEELDHNIKHQLFAPF
jgi:class 3 adenylate cyclase